LTTIHEVGHLLDLMAIGTPGDFATVNLDGGMGDVLTAANGTAAVAQLRVQLSSTTSQATTRHLSYLLSPWEIWARAYTQFIAERSGNDVLRQQLAAALQKNGSSQWTTADFAPLAAAIEKMFRDLNWL
jgi:hypothetical protein